MKNKNLIVRLDEREIIILDEVCKFLECTRSEFVRNGIALFYFAIKQNLLTKEEP